MSRLRDAGKMMIKDYGALVAVLVVVVGGIAILSGLNRNIPTAERKAANEAREKRSQQIALRVADIARRQRQEAREFWREARSGTGPGWTVGDGVRGLARLDGQRKQVKPSRQQGADRQQQQAQLRRQQPTEARSQTAQSGSPGDDDDYLTPWGERYYHFDGGDSPGGYSSYNTSSGPTGPSVHSSSYASASPSQPSRYSGWRGGREVMGARSQWTQNIGLARFSMECASRKYLEDPSPGRAAHLRMSTDHYLDLLENRPEEP